MGASQVLRTRQQLEHLYSLYCSDEYTCLLRRLGYCFIMENALQQLRSWAQTLPEWAQAVLGLMLLVLICVLVDLLVKGQLIRLVRGFAKRTRHNWDDIVIAHNVFGRLAQAVPAIIIFYGVQWLPALPESVVELIKNVALAYLALVVTMALGSLLRAGNAIYSQYPIARDRPIKGFVQVAIIVVYVLGAVLVVSALLAKSPLVLLTGFGAMTAILLLVFKDTILSLVASIQLSSLDMVRVGDWIEMPAYNADGDVIDVALHTVKIQNWDKTITTIPTHRLISESFKNWRGMSESGGRRIKRAIHLDMNTVRFLSDQEVEKFRTFSLLRDYVERKQEELAQYNQALGDTANVNLRRLTNLGTFRAYIWNYLRHHPAIHDQMTVLVRQLQPGANGIPIEIYAFTNTTDWAAYEAVQADVFDHLLAQSDEFGLQAFQHPSGVDVAAIGLPDNPATTPELPRTE